MHLNRFCLCRLAHAQTLHLVRVVFSHVGRDLARKIRLASNRLALPTRLVLLRLRLNQFSLLNFFLLQSDSLFLSFQRFRLHPLQAPFFLPLDLLLSLLLGDGYLHSLLFQPPLDQKSLLLQPLILKSLPLEPLLFKSFVFKSFVFEAFLFESLLLSLQLLLPLLL